MRALDATYCFDILRRDPGARERAVEWESQQEVLAIPAPALAEFLRSGYRRGGRLLEGSLALTRRLEVLSLDADAAEDAARLGGELVSCGEFPIIYREFLSLRAPLAPIILAF